MTAMTFEGTLRPMSERARWERPVVAALAVSAVAWLAAAVRLVVEGHRLLGTQSYGVSWGLTVANVIHIIGISHVGIAVSAAVRILRLDRYRNVARLAEVMTLIALVVAVLNIALDVGRPDRFLAGALIHGRWNAPMVWSATVISLYFLSSSVYLYLSLRRDLWLMGGPRSLVQRTYRRLAMDYGDTAAERERHEQTLRWLALALVPVMVSVHSVYGLFFGMMSARAGWYNPLQAPYFVLGAVVSGFSALIVAAALLRWLYRWEEILDERTFRVFGSVLTFVVFLYLYFVVSEHVTAQFAASPAERAVSRMLLAGAYSGPFWLTILGGLVMPLLMLLRQVLRARPVSVATLAIAAGAVNVAMLAKRILLVVPTQQSTHLPLPVPLVAYRPTLVEMTATFGTYAVGGLLFIAALKLIPLIELPRAQPVPSFEAGSPLVRRVLVVVTILTGLALVTWGVLTRNADWAPMKWIAGMCLVAITPLERCVVKDRAIAAVPETETGGVK